jgi:aryl-alcohol dehydrogenase-like predicted oxidoreductase
MEKRKLGKSGLEVAPLCLGGNVFGWTADEQMSFRLLDYFVDEGFGFIDTADIYSTWVPGHKGGESETIIGKWLKRSGKRSQVTIATKVGMEMDSDRKGLKKAYILSEVEASLKRLQTDSIDLYQSHQDDPLTPIEETLEAYSLLIKQGKVRAIGASNFTRDRLLQSLETSQELGFPAYQSLQPLYNLYDRESYEKELELLCLEKGIGVIPYYSLASGFLTGKYRSEKDFSKSPRGGGMAPYLNDRGMKILATLDQIAEEHRATPARVALAWLIARPSITAPIASATNLDQMKELTQAANLRLDPASLKKLQKVSDTF